MEFQMEAGEIRTYNFEGNMGTSSGHVNPAAPPAQAEHFCGLRFDPSPESAAKKNGNASPQISPENNAPPSVSNCYVFKSRLQEYAQRAGLTTPVYETIKEGPSHEPFFRSTVIVNNVRYDSLPGFFHRKAAEQSAAEVALVEISRTTEAKFGITVPVHETGLCKNLLQEYAQKMNYAIPLYECTKEEKQGRTRNSNSTYFCTIEIGGTRYIGASASTKKEAEIKAARTALLAIQSAASASEQRTDKSVYTVVPQKKRGSDPEISTEETAAALKTKKCHFKKQQRKRTRSFLKKRDKRMKLKMSGQGAMESIVGDASLQNTTDAVKVVMVGQGGGGGEVGLTDGVNSLDKAADGSEVKTDCQAVTEPSLTDFVSSQGEYSVLDHMEMKSTPCAGIHNGGLENVSVPSDGLCKDGESLKLDASVTGTGLVNMIDIRGYLSGL